MIKLTILLLLVFSINPARAANLDEAMGVYNKGDYKKAVSLLTQLRNANPDDAPVRFLLGKAYLKIRDWDNAIREMEKCTQLQPSNAQYFLWLGRACGEKASNSVFFKAPGWARRVLKSFEAARNVSPNDVDVRFDLMEYYLQAPGFLGGGKDKAAAEMQVIAKLDPRKAYVARSILLRQDKKWDQAKAELVQATLDFPKDADTYKDLADFLLGRKDFKAALQNAAKALAIRGDSKRTRLLVAAASTRLRTDLEHSARTLADMAAGPLTDNDPSFEEVYYWLGECYLAQGDKNRAREAFTSVLAFNPENEGARERISKLK